MGVLVRPESMERITTRALAEAYIAEQIADIKNQVGDRKVLLALSGGVDSSVVAALLIKAIGQNLICVHVNHGLLRKGEPEQVIEVFRNQMNANLIYVDAADRFLDKLAGVADPETKRHIIGEEFIDVFAEEARKLDGVDFLAQGTIWPDILESEAGIQASACNYLVKTSLLRENNLHFIDTNYWEDLVFTFDLVTYISSAVLLPDITYTYICREDSLSHYQQRKCISKDEIMQNVRAINYLKQTSSILFNKVYFPNRCFIIILTDFYIACNILKRRKDIQPYITNKEIKALMFHPATWSQICCFKQSRLSNIVLYILGKIPSSLCVTTIWCLGKMKKLI